MHSFYPLKVTFQVLTSKLTVDAKDGTVTIAGTVPTKEQLAKVQPLAKEIKGVKAVNVKATVALAQNK